MSEWNFEDTIHNGSLDYILTLNKSLKSQAQQPIQQELSLQVLLHIISCLAALRDYSQDAKSGSTKSALHDHVIQPFITGMIATMGKVIMDSFMYDPKLSDQDSFRDCYKSLMLHVFRLFPDVASRKHKSSGKLLLHHAAFKARPYIMETALRSILAALPNSAEAVDITHATALHWATRNEEISGEAMGIIIEANPRALNAVDDKGFMPLHWAVNVDQPNLEAVRRLLKAYPDAAAIPTRSGHVPLHYIVMHARPNQAVLKALLAACPEAAQKTCHQGQLPIHRLVHRSPVDLDSLRELVKVNHAALMQQTETGHTPLMMCLDFPRPDHAAARLIFAENNAAAGIPDLADFYPLHMVLDTAKPDYILAESILNAHPAAAMAVTKEGMTPLHLLVTTNEAPPLAFVEQLLAANPTAAAMNVHDIVPMRNGVILQDTRASESWSGEWVKQEWTPAKRAAERGLDAVAELLKDRERRRLQFSTPLRTVNTAEDVKKDSAVVSKNKPLQTPPTQPVTTTNAAAPRRFVLPQDSDKVLTKNAITEQQQQAEEAHPDAVLHFQSSSAQQQDREEAASESRTTFNAAGSDADDEKEARNNNHRRPVTAAAATDQPLRLNNFLTGNNSNNNDGDLPSNITRNVKTAGNASIRTPSSDDDNTPSKDKTTFSPSLLQVNNPDMREREQDRESSDGGGTRKKQPRAPPAGPIPASLLQAAETNAMRLSKAQYEFLKSGRAGNGSTTSGSSAGTKKSTTKISKQQLLLTKTTGQIPTTATVTEEKEKDKDSDGGGFFDTMSVASYDSNANGGSGTESGLITAPVRTKKAGGQQPLIRRGGPSAAVVPVVGDASEMV